MAVGNRFLVHLRPEEEEWGWLPLYSLELEEEPHSERSREEDRETIRKMRKREDWIETTRREWRKLSERR
jgi:hypothetical protein